MTLKVVGSGLGRTGTKSLHTALNILGFGPCHHMVEVFMHPKTVPLWIAAGKGHADWNAIFKGYVSMVDYPGAAYWRAIAAHYPEALVLHSVRDADAWFESTQATIFANDFTGPDVRPDIVPMAEFFLSFMGPFRDHLRNRAFMTEYFRRHTEEVIRAIPPERLLVYEVREGWAPLCTFLNVPVPPEPFPSENSRAEFIARQHNHAR